MRLARPATPRVPWFRAVRIAALLLVLVLVAFTTWQDRYRSTRWVHPLFVAIYPIAADDSPATRTYVDGLDDERFKPIDRFFAREARRHGLSIDEPFRTRRRPELARQPPALDPGAGPLATAAWSLELRYWAWRAGRNATEPQDIRVFVLYHDPKITPAVPHSLGLAKGLIGVVYAFADPLMSAANDVVIAHELLHTVGATDKYDPANDAPRYPDGYGDPRQTPLYPQSTAELMAGRRMLSADRWEQPASLDEVVVGAATAREIRWPRQAP